MNTMKKMSELGGLAPVLRKRVDAAVREWQPRSNKKVRILGAETDLSMESGNGYLIAVCTVLNQIWNLRIDGSTLIDANPR